MNNTRYFFDFDNGKVIYQFQVPDIVDMLLSTYIKNVIMMQTFRELKLEDENYEISIFRKFFGHNRIIYGYCITLNNKNYAKPTKKV